MTGAALIVMDLQNDFCTGPGALSRYPGPPERLAAVTANAARAVEIARSRGIEVVFVRFLGDAVYQGASWRRRDQRRGRSPKCCEGTWGAEFHQVIPQPGEFIATKRACFDAFLAPGFEEHLVRLRVEHLVFAGVFADVCVDSTARTAFQKGWHITVLTDCTTSLILPEATTLEFMTSIYGAQTATHDQPNTWWGTP